MRLTHAKRLVRLMAVQDVTQRELAAAAGWKSHSYLGRLLRQEAHTLDRAAAVQISQYLGVELDDLFAHH